MLVTGVRRRELACFVTASCFSEVGGGSLTSAALTVLSTGERSGPLKAAIKRAPRWRGHYAGFRSLWGDHQVVREGHHLRAIHSTLRTSENPSKVNFSHMWREACGAFGEDGCWRWCGWRCRFNWTLLQIRHQNCGAVCFDGRACMRKLGGS